MLKREDNNEDDDDENADVSTSPMGRFVHKP